MSWEEDFRVCRVGHPWDLLSPRAAWASAPGIFAEAAALRCPQESQVRGFRAIVPLGGL